MNVADAVASRHSTRGFLDQQVPPALIRKIIAQATRAPSGGNLQPWHLHILGGEPLQNFKTLMQQRLDDKTLREEPEYHVYPPHLVPPFTDRLFAVGEALYARLGIPREDKLARRAWFARNFAFFGAPLALFCTVDRLMGPPQWSDLGMLLQTIMLLLRAEGLDSCAQECWALYPRTISEFLNLPPERMLFCGMSIGYADPAQPANQLVTTRAPLDEVAQFIGL